jgi:MFS transporter, DHA1 family, tetracycline resistance protein
MTSTGPDAIPAAQAPKPLPPAMWFILGVVMLDMLAIGIIVPVLAPYVARYFPGDVDAGAHAFGIVMTVWAVTNFFMAPVLGALSDQFGRRPVILISCIGLGLSFFATALAPSFAFLVASRIISGATAGNMSAANAYVADVTAPQDRARAFGMLGAAFGVGFTMGPALGGLLGSIDMRLPFVAAGVLALVNAAYGLFVLPESLKPENRSRFSLAKANPIGALMVFRGQPGLYALLPVYGLYALAYNVFPTSFVLYATHRFAFDTQTVGLTMAASAVLNIIAQALLVQQAVKRFGEMRALLIGLSGGVVGFCAYGLAPTAPLFWASMPIMMLVSLFIPSIQAIMTKRVSPAAQGRLQGGLASVMGSAGVIAPLLYTSLFAWGVKGSVGGAALPGAPFLAASLFVFLAIPIAVLAMRMGGRDPGSPPPTATAADASVDIAQPEIVTR